MRVLFISNFYNAFLDQVYAHERDLAGMPYDQQLQRLMATGFGISDSYTNGMSSIGVEAIDVISNASPLQHRWSVENAFMIPEVRTWHHDVLEAQVRAFRPDVLYVFEYNPVGDVCLARLKRFVPLLVGQIASNLPPRRTFDAYDLMVSSWPPIVDHFQTRGGRGRYLPLGFDDRVLDRLGHSVPEYDVTFVGGLADCHRDRRALLERICSVMDVHIFGYGAESLPPESAILRCHHGPVWGMEMYDVLRSSKITLNVHAETNVRGQVDRRFTNNMRLYEATGVGTCLLTENRENLRTLFDPERQILTYEHLDDCLAKVKAYLDDDTQRGAVARAGQERTLKNHTYGQRMIELKEILVSALRRTGSRRSVLSNSAAESATSASQP